MLLILTGLSCFSSRFIRTKSSLCKTHEVHKMCHLHHHAWEFAYYSLFLYPLVEVALEDGDSDTITTANEADINSAINGILEAAQGAPVEQRTDGEASGRCLKRRRNTRSLIWRHFERLESLAAARCRICKKKIQCFDSSTSNLHRHMSKRHPEASQLAGDVQNPPISKSPHGSNANGDTSALPETVEVSEHREFPGNVLKLAASYESNKFRLFRMHLKEWMENIQTTC